MTGLARCPICGEEPDYLMGNLEETEFKVGCSRCHVFTVASDGRKAQEMWNDICSKEVKEGPKLKPCPFCGAEDVNLKIEYDDCGDEYIYCAVCDSIYQNCTTDKTIEGWNRRVNE